MIAILGLLLAPRPAVASCGNHVAFKGPDGVSNPAGEKTSADDHLPVIPAPNKPCHGPNCSRHTTLPLAPTPTTHSRNSQHDLVGTRPVSSHSPEPARFPAQHFLLSFVSLSFEIFHPPRLS
jgi:hypothetical protein